MENKKRIDERNKFNGRLTIVVMVFTLLLLVSLVLLYFVSRHEESMKGADTQIKLSAQGGFSCEYSEAQKLYPFGEGVLKVTTDRAAYLTISGNEIYAVSLNLKNPQCVTDYGYSVVYDLDGYSFQVLDDKGQLYTKPTSNQIKSAFISPQGYVAIITNNSTSYGEVFLFNSNGEVISEWSSYNSGYPISVAFNSDSSYMAITTINTTGAVAVPYLRVFSLISGNKGIEVEDSAVYAADSNDILATCFYLDNSLYAFSANSFYKVQSDKIELVESKYSTINYVSLVGNKIYIVYSDGVDQLNKLSLINSSENTIYDSPVGTKINAVCSTDNLYAISVDNRIFVYNNNGVVIGDVSVDEDILRMDFIKGNALCVVSTSGVHTVNY